MVLIDGERLGALGDAGDELLHLQESAAGTVTLEAPHRNVGGSDTICRGVTGVRVTSGDHNQNDVNI